jgi:isoleucyl-tRNA synthetase
MVDYREEMRISRQILSRAVEAYRKIRNTMRYLVANLYDFDPAVDRVAPGAMEEVDRFILGRYASLARRLEEAYDAYEYPSIFQAMNAFTTVDLSALYNDITKDRLYTFGARSRERRSAQTALYVMADGLARLMAPILPVTADELWRHLPGSREESVHMSLFPPAADLAAWIDAPLLERWTGLMALRERVLAEIEPMRKDKRIGSSLQAKIVLAGTPAALAPLAPYRRDLSMLFIVSEVELRPAAARGTGESADSLEVIVERAGGVKCERCWRYVPSVSSEPSWAGLCERCQGALAETIRG